MNDKRKRQTGELPEAQYTLAPEDTGVNEASVVNAKYTLSDKLWKYLFDYAAKHKAKGNGFGFGLCGPEDLVGEVLQGR